MKKVLFNDELETISVNSLKDTDFIGVKMVGPNLRGHILRININQYVINTITSNNPYVGKIIFSSISEALNFEGIGEVVVFKSRKELLKWIIS
jgi:hypothetical protein